MRKSILNPLLTIWNIILIISALLFPIWFLSAIWRVYRFGPLSLIYSSSDILGGAKPWIAIFLFWSIAIFGVVGIAKLINVNRRQKETKSPLASHPIWYTKKVALWHMGLCLIIGLVVCFLEHIGYVFNPDLSLTSKLLLGILGVFNLSINLFGWFFAAYWFFPSKPECFFLENKVVFYVAYAIFIPINALIYWGLIRLWTNLYRKLADSASARENTIK